ncbi:nuclear transport factor 2 family protein [Plantactinospora sp. CA-290183]|uniref:nuclear transport factor 2 family protein n=1 Tax=Plantactinospora sp. CA-290183 TaxID=3240006 RepID=UPI003D8D6C01
MTSGTSGQSRRVLMTAALTGGLTMLAGTAPASAGPREDGGGPASGRSARERRNKAAVLRAFAQQNAGGDLYEILHDDIDWTIVNGRTYTSKAEFLAEGSAPVMDRLVPPLVMTVQDLWTEGDIVIVRFVGDATAIDGIPYHNEYCWVWQLRGGQVVRCHAFLDMLAVRELVERVDLD